MYFPPSATRSSPISRTLDRELTDIKGCFETCTRAFYEPWRKKVANIVTTFSCKYLSIRARYKLILVPDVAAIVLSSSRKFLHRPAPFLPPRYGLPLPIYVRLSSVFHRVCRTILLQQIKFSGGSINAEATTRIVSLWQNIGREGQVVNR